MWRKIPDGPVALINPIASYIPLNDPFPNCERHHIDEVHVIHIPKHIHHTHPHNRWTGEGMEEINKIAATYLKTTSIKESIQEADNQFYRDPRCVICGESVDQDSVWLETFCKNCLCITS